MTKQQKIEQADAIAKLRAILPPGSTVYTVLRNVSRSGMTREISLYSIEDGNFNWLTGLAARALGLRIGKRDGLIIGGCGMDMGFHLVYSLSRALWRENFTCIGRDEMSRCPSNDHSNGDRDYSPHAHSDGGYALRHRWI